MLRLLVALLLCLSISAQDTGLSAPTGDSTVVTPNTETVRFDSQLPIQEEQQSVNPPPPTTEEIVNPPVQEQQQSVNPPPTTEVVTTPTKPAPVVVETVWLCDQTGARRGSAGSPETEKLIAQGITLVDCVNRPQQNGNMMCDANGRPRGRSSSPYVRALNSRGVQLQPCPSGNGNGNGNRNGNRYSSTATRIGGNLENRLGNSMCDANGRPRGRASSPYVQALTRQGVQLQPCTQGNANGNGNRNGNRNGIVGNRLGGSLGSSRLGGNTAGIMCDANGRPRGRASSPYVQALTRQGMQLTPCSAVQGARATDPSATELDMTSTAPSTSSTAAPAPGWAIALIVVGSILLVVLILVIVHVTRVLKLFYEN